ncbi:MAG: phosphotransferase [Cyclonatronaceae bacterium]
MNKPLHSSLIDFVKQNLPDWEPDGTVGELTGGNLNHVFRVGGSPDPVIVKHAPPYIASAPDVPLHPGRLTFESKALHALLPGGLLAEITAAVPRVAPPAWIAFDAEQNLLAMEDLGEYPSITDAFDQGNCKPTSGTQLGRFIGRLHAETYGCDKCKKMFSNSGVQQTRHKVQYLPAAEWLAHHHPNEKESADRIIELGLQLQQPGYCLIMGDLWPPSIMVQQNQLRLFDWEFVHYGHPLQDVAHIAAHFLMWSIVHPDIKRNVLDCWHFFWDAYQHQIANIPALLNEMKEQSGFPLHVGAELWIRSLGPFREGYLFDNIPDSDERFKTVVKQAILMMTTQAKASPDVWLERFT